ncbi:unnamed protein product, partial [Brugia pahangi]|uniref:C2H2-type domain-containing protein n=1 Tax=Brugia pahangi TaxID=6280 RepID=A0A0N4TDB8_BRUPA
YTVIAKENDREVTHNALTHFSLTRLSDVKIKIFHNTVSFVNLFNFQQSSRVLSTAEQGITPQHGNFRTVLKRPDLKGTFRCSICQKIFCHSSSLSRHRMQAHFKSYTCTLCRKEITKKG